jgi:hypothetical protein
MGSNGSFTTNYSPTQYGDGSVEGPAWSAPHRRSRQAGPP